MRVSRWKDLYDWLPSDGDSADIPAHFAAVPLGDFLHRKRRVIDKSLTPLETLNVIEKISFGGVLHLRTANKKQGYKGPLFRAEPEEIVISKIRVGQGSLCVVPDTLEHLAVSPEYPVYRADPKQVRAKFLNILLRAPNFQRLFRSASSGNTTKKRISPEIFEGVSIPLPEPDEQDRLLERFDHSMEQARSMEDDANIAEKHGIQQFETALGLTPPPDLPHRLLQIARYRDMDRWGHEALLQQALRERSLTHSYTQESEAVPLGDFVEVAHGCSVGPSEKRTTLEFLKISAVTRGYFRPSEKKFAPDRQELRKKFDLS